MASVFEDVRNKPMRHPPVTSSATGGAFPTLRRAARHYNGIECRFAAIWLEMQTGSKLQVTVLESTGPGEDSTGAGAERELGFDPQPKAELTQGEYKGAREVLARHVYTAEPRGGPGGC